MTFSEHAEKVRRDLTRRSGDDATRNEEALAALFEMERQHKNALAVATRERRLLERAGRAEAALATTQEALRRILDCEDCHGSGIVTVHVNEGGDPEEDPIYEPEECYCRDLARAVVGGDETATNTCNTCGHSRGLHERVAFGERRPCGWDNCECTNYNVSGGDE